MVVWLIIGGLTLAGAGVLLWLTGRWLATSWELLDDDQLGKKLREPGLFPAASLLMQGWLRGGTRRLTYRRDERGRFRRVRR